MGKGGGPDWMIERGRGDRSGRAWRKKTLQGKREWSVRVEKCRSRGLGQTNGWRDSRSRKMKGNAVVHSHTPHPLQPSPLTQTHNQCAGEEGHERERE